MPVKELPGFRIGAAALLAVVGCVGCQPRIEQRINAELARSGEKRALVFPLSGRVRIDGQPPSATIKGRKRLFAMLYDVSKPELRPELRPHVEADPDGSFRFSTYGVGDGVPAATYVFTFAVLKNQKKEGYLGPDGLKNHYNDPEKNEKDSEFRIEHKAPGKTDYLFDLKSAGEEEQTPGRKALTKFAE